MADRPPPKFSEMVAFATAVTVVIGAVCGVIFFCIHIYFRNQQYDVDLIQRGLPSGTTVTCGLISGCAAAGEEWWHPGWCGGRNEKCMRGATELYLFGRRGYLLRDLMGREI